MITIPTSFSREGGGNEPQSQRTLRQAEERLEKLPAV